MLDPRHQPRERVHRARPLQSEQRLLVKVIDRDVVGQMLAQMRDIFIFGRAVDHHVEAVIAPRDYQVIKHPAIIGQQQRVSHPPLAQALHVARQQRLQRARHVNRVRLARKDELAHMADIEQTRRLAHPKMLGHDAFILDRHQIARERDHAASPRAMPGIERQQLRPRLRVRIDVAVQRAPARVRFVIRAVVDRFAQSPTPAKVQRAWRPDDPDLTRCPLCHGNLKASPGRDPGLPLRWPTPKRQRFPERHATRGPWCLRVSGAVAPSAASRRSALPREPWLSPA